MNRKLVIAFLCMIFISKIAVSQTYIYAPAILVSYDNSGNRIVRQMEVICINCPPPIGPKIASTDTSRITNKVDNISIRAYPNPTQETLHIENLTWITGGDASVRIFDLSGKLMFIKKINTDKIDIPFGSMVPGSYQVEYYLDNKLSSVWKIIKQ